MLALDFEPSAPASPMTRKVSRRKFLGQSARTTLGTLGAGSLGAGVIGWHTFPSPSAASTSPSEKLNLAAIGTGNRAAANLAACANQNIVALADIDADFLSAASNRYDQARVYRDFRVMLEREGDKLDAVIVSTPDHTHAAAAAMAMRMGKHTYCEKPLTHTVYEARRLSELAAEKQLVTQMGTQIHAGDNYRRVVELVESGTIGAVREVHVWVGVNYSGGKLMKTKQPSGVDWDLWLGPTVKRDYVESTINGKHETVHPYHWRWFWDYGNGGLGDFGCHYMDLAHWALKLKDPTIISANGPELNQEAATSGIVVEYQYPARGDLPPVTLTWYDGGRRPDVLSDYKDAEGRPLNWGSGQLFVGEHGAIISNYGSHMLLPVGRASDFTRPEPYISPSIGHHTEWIEAIKSGGSTTCDFSYAGALTESVLLGVVSYRSGETLNWDAKHARISNSEKAQQMIHREYRNGWTL